MALATKTFRIFISSTFSDMKRERNALQERVFPKLRELCLQHGCRFQAIDLRWGVGEEAALDQQTMKICLGEIDRCRKTSPRPNFIVLLGDRYGWRPLPAEIPAAEYEQIEKRVNSPEDKALLHSWYKRDENQVPPVYILQPREVKIREGSSAAEIESAREAESREWIQAESRLRRILLLAVQGIPLTEDQRLKYTASATEQEIVAGAMRVSDAPEHVFCFFRKINNWPKNMILAKDFIDLDENGGVDKDSAARLDTLKMSLRSKLSENVFEYEAGWTEKGLTTAHLDRLCEDVDAGLSRIILKEIEKLEDLDALEKEIDDHVAFGLERSRFFIGRTKILGDIQEYLNDPERTPLAIFGKPGSGKSALMAKAFERALEANPQGCCLTRFIGATPGTSDIRNLLDGLCRQISRAYEASEADIPSDFKELAEDFPKRLALATAEKPLILFLDALDQLSDAHNARSLVWLPAELPEHVRIVVSLLPGDSLEAVKNKMAGDHILELEAMPAKEGESLLDLWLKDAGRRLQKPQREEVLGKFRKNGLPLYLKLAFENASHWRSYTTDFALSPDIAELIQAFFARLSDEAHHGEMLVSRGLGFLAAAKNGLSEDELLDLLSADGDVVQDFMRRSPRSPQVDRLPVVVWSRLYFDLEPYLIERSADGASLMTFYHPTTIGNEVKKAFLSDDIKTARHRHLAEYFGKQDLFKKKDEIHAANLRKISELPYQQTRGELWNEVYETLTDFEFLEAKCTYASVTRVGQGEESRNIYGGVYELMEDYRSALENYPRE
ncbi:MAG: DUF4062 domain-containing protein [Deltaproteobacteria bacterium]|nr:DUF4062 domain-containing protein [Deltaproteobacteria bacterium]